MFQTLNFLLVLFCTIVFAIPTQDEKKDRVINDLSSQEHYPNQHHNLEYDHEAFLGTDEAKTFYQLSPEESRRRLGIIVDKIDKDGDKKITHEELKDWIKYSQRKYITDDVKRQWAVHNPENKESIDWESYRKNVYSYADEMDPEEFEREEGGYSYKKMIKRDRRRWTMADKNGDDLLNKEEFQAFLHPEDTEDMTDIIVLETMDDIDTDGDGKISMDEYVSDMYNKGSDDEVEPDWVKSEREHFTAYRDQNNDGYLNADEVREWVSPKDFDHAEAESKHLIYEADENKDEVLTKEEILAKYDLFVGSQATDFGEALARHDEF
ncbi:calumenin-A-like [Chrysoperla carnea]|uniref:calumenin-A-like n=1 Tax=Chrysoperla carnea TaxID=189513 RepID=UPI001D0768BE|nr:calumenin-A-like [Chrysoperla carnea]